ncbi:MAG: recombinase family protein [Hyphomicrobium sp.]
MLVGSMRVSTVDQSTELQRDALIVAGVESHNIYSDKASGGKDDRPGLEACLNTLREGDALPVWKLDRLGRSVHHLVESVRGLADRKVGFRVLTGQGANIDTTTATGKLVFGIFAAFAEFERDLISERTRAGLSSARARGRKGDRRRKLNATLVAGAKARLGEGKAGLEVQALATELAVNRTTLWRALKRAT